MKFLQIRRSIIFVIFASAFNKTHAQALVADSASSPAVKNAVAVYSSAFKEQLHLYNGKEYREYSHPFDQGHPYFIESNLSDGTVTYDGNTYNDVSLLYNVVTEEVIILGFNQVTKIKLLKDRISAFSLLEHSFVNIGRDSLPGNMSPGFYDVLVKGKTSLIAKRTKNIQLYERRPLEYRVFSRDHYYIRKNNRYFRVSSKKSLLEQLSDRRKELQQYMRKNKLKVRKGRENTMIRTVEYYNQLTK